MSVNIISHAPPRNDSKLFRALLNASEALFPFTEGGAARCLSPQRDDLLKENTYAFLKRGLTAAVFADPAA